MPTVCTSVIATVVRGRSNSAVRAANTVVLAHAVLVSVRLEPNVAVLVDELRSVALIVSAGPLERSVRLDRIVRPVTVRSVPVKRAVSAAWGTRSKPVAPLANRGAQRVLVRASNTAKVACAPPASVGLVNFVAMVAEWKSVISLAERGSSSKHVARLSIVVLVCARAACVALGRSVAPATAGLWRSVIPPARNGTAPRPVPMAV